MQDGCVKLEIDKLNSPNSLGYADHIILIHIDLGPGQVGQETVEASLHSQQPKIMWPFQASV